MTLRSLVLTGLALMGLNLAPLAGASPYQRFDAPNLALTNATVIDGRDQGVMRETTILVEEGRIVAIQGAEAPIAEGYTRVDLDGHTVIPGLVMMHEHLFYPTGNGHYGDMLYSFPKLYLAGGATTIRTAGTTAPYGDLGVARGVARGREIGPDMNVTAPYLNGPGLPILKIHPLRDAQNAHDLVTYWQSEGVESFKLYMQIRQDEMETALKLAHERGQTVTGHLCSITLGQAAELGIDNIEHGFITATDFVSDKQADTCPDGQSVKASLLALPVDSPKMAALIDKLVANNVAITSTLTIYETFAKGRPIAYSEALAQMTPHVRELYLSRWSAIQQSDSEQWRELLAKEMAWEKRFVEAGGTLLVGTDPTGYGGVVAGWSNLRALELLLETGFTLPEAVRIASYNGAHFLGRDHEVGTIEVGKRADLAIFSSDLTGDSANFKGIRYTMKAGKLYDSQAIFADLKGIVGLH
ncbi:amidohydrolase family protein [Ferrimonas balearica]|uniref:amidohydrolase family protein n=1 Tax=Ferrimonas balearica TaxID=44012 RepID=UPI001C991CE9|nr:amidohydrolase family protein [Ferrimonas balearica]MBY5991400.1 amidohydrolase family protein [Ferrimonas balearica]